MATLIRHARSPFPQQSTYLVTGFISSRAKINKNCVRRLSHILQRSTCQNGASYRQLQKLIKHFQRFNSTGQVQLSATEAAKTVTGSSGAKDVSYIPAPPQLPRDEIPPEMADISESFNALGEPSLHSLGLGSYYPPGLIQQALEFIHVNLDLPWFASIALLTTLMRLCIFPVFVKQQKLNVKLSYILPTYQELQTKARNAQLEGDHTTASSYQYEAVEYGKKHRIKTAMFLTPMVQGPVFASVFWGFRRMAELPVESLRNGGALWFTDLTVPDPYFGLPLFTSFTLGLVLKMGAEGVDAQTMSPIVRKLMMYGMPTIIFMFIQGFPSMMLVYWTTSNAISLILAYFFRKKAVRDFFKIPNKKPPSKKQMQLMTEKITFHSITNLGKKKFKELTVMSQMQDRDRVNADIFKKSGQGPVQETFFYNPTLVNKQTKTKKLQKMKNKES